MRQIVNVGRVASPTIIDSYFRNCLQGTKLTLSFQDSFTGLYDGREVRGLWEKSDESKYRFVEGTNFISLFNPEIEDDVYPDEMVRPFMHYPGGCEIHQGRMLDDFVRAPQRENYKMYPELERVSEFQYIPFKSQEPCPW